MTRNAKSVSLFSATEKPNANAFLWNKHMMLSMNCRGYANAQFMQPEPSKYAFSPSLEVKTFMQPEHPYFAHHPGRFFYVKDRTTGQIFSLPFAPCQQSFDDYEFIAGNEQVEWRIKYLGLRFTLALRLAQDAACEYWKLDIEAISNEPKEIDIIAYFPLGYMSWMNQSANFAPDSQAIIANYVTPYQKLEDYPSLKETAQNTFLAGDRPVQSWCASQQAFEGLGGLAKPDAVVAKQLPNNAAYYETPTAALRYSLSLSEDTESLHFVFGPCHSNDDSAQLIKGHLAACKSSYDDKDEITQSESVVYPFQVETKDTAFDEFINQWLPRQVFYHGDVNRLTTDPQTRNYIQDNIGMCFIRPASARHCLLTALSQQKRSGEMPDGILIHPDAELKYINQIPHSDHCIWLPLLLEVYLDQTNDIALLRTMLNFQDSNDEKTLIEHIELALNWVLAKRDARGLCFIEQGDWCDPMNMVGPDGKGVSAWLSLALAYAIKVWLRIVKNYQLDAPIVALEEQLMALQSAVIKHCWDGDWFARGITDNNELFGVSSDNEGKIFLNPQSWALLAGIDSEQHKEKILKAVDAHLQTPFGNQMLAPCFTKMDERIGRVTQKFPGSAENGSIYNHAFAFWIYAMFESNEAEKGYLNLREMFDALYSEQAGQLPIFLPNYFRGAYKQFPELTGKSSHLFNTGTAAWVYRIVIEQLFGLRGCSNSLFIKPQLPVSMGNCTIDYAFRGAQIAMQVSFSTTVNKQKTLINGEVNELGVIKDITKSKCYQVEVTLPAEPKKATPQLIIVCGVSGSGKSSVAQALAHEIDAMFVEGDDLHSRVAKDKMSQGIALDDEDREPWIDRLCIAATQKLKHGYATVVTCSGLKERYRSKLLSISENAKLIMLSPSQVELSERLRKRQNHFFKAELLQSQLSAMQPISDKEKEQGVAVIDSQFMLEYTQKSSKSENTAPSLELTIRAIVDLLEQDSRTLLEL